MKLYRSRFGLEQDGYQCDSSAGHDGLGDQHSIMCHYDHCKLPNMQKSI